MPSGPRRSWLLPTLVGGLAIAVVALTIGLAWALNRDDLPSKPAAFRAPADVIPTNVYEVKAADAEGLILASADGSDIRVPRPATIDTVVPGSALKAGDWVNVIGIVDEVRNFSIRAILVLPEHGAAGPDGVARTPAGFSGLETRRDPAERIIMGGQVVKADATTATLAGATGEITMTLTPAAEVLTVAKGDPASVRAGDRLASAQAAIAGSALPAAIVILQAPAAGTASTGSR